MIAGKQQRPLTIAILPRSVKYVLYNEDPDPPRDFRPGPLEYMHKDTAFNMSRPTVRVRAEEIPVEMNSVSSLKYLLEPPRPASPRRSCHPPVAYSGQCACRLASARRLCCCRCTSGLPWWPALHKI
jgi:hypothetical protein